MASIPQCSIEQVGSEAEPIYVIHQQIDGTSQVLDKQFSDYQEALNFILAQGWQVQRERPKDSMIIASRYLKP